MFSLTKKFRFEASHVLEDHDGKCARLHGHSWYGELVVQGKELQGVGPKRNMLVDYADIGKAAKHLHEILDHRHLNEVLETSMPTSEFIAQWAFEEVATTFPDIPWAGVAIEETCTSRCEYFPGVTVTVKIPIL